MRLTISLCFLTLSLSVFASDSIKTAHIFVALCDNKNQGIVPVPEALGNGQDPANNLYWGALYGVKTYFKKSSNWQLLKSYKNPEKYILERLIFKHAETGTIVVADAWNGAFMKETITAYFNALSGAFKDSITINGSSVPLNGSCDLVAFVGHNGLMDFRLSSYPQNKDGNSRDAIILACLSKRDFSDGVKRANGTPLLWTTGLMAPEAYITEAALNAWAKNKTEDIQPKAAEAYSKYQKCNINAAKRLLVGGK